jgi:hypothetical protein
MTVLLPLRLRHVWNCTNTPAARESPLRSAVTLRTWLPWIWRQPRRGVYAKPTVSNAISTYKEKWLGHTQTSKRVFENNDITFYYNDGIDPKITWPLQHLTRVWQYVKKTYGNFGTEGGWLHPVFTGVSAESSTASELLWPRLWLSKYDWRGVQGWKVQEQ